jgi:hypothetical protein
LLFLTNLSNVLRLPYPNQNKKPATGAGLLFWLGD